MSASKLRGCVNSTRECWSSGTRPSPAVTAPPLTATASRHAALGARQKRRCAAGGRAGDDREGRVEQVQVLLYTRAGPSHMRPAAARCSRRPHGVRSCASGISRGFAPAWIFVVGNAHGLGRRARGLPQDTRARPHCPEVGAAGRYAGTDRGRRGRDTALAQARATIAQLSTSRIEAGRLRVKVSWRTGRSRAERVPAHRVLRSARCQRNRGFGRRACMRNLGLAKRRSPLLSVL